MSVNFSLQVLFRAKPQDVFSALVSLEDYPLWLPSFVALEPLNQGAFGMGSQWRETRNTFGKNAQEVFEVRMFEVNDCLQLYVDGRKGSTGKGSFLFTYELVGQGDCTLLNLTTDIDMPGYVFKLFGKVFIKTLQSSCERDLEALRSFVHNKRADSSAA